MKTPSYELVAKSMTFDKDGHPIAEGRPDAIRCLICMLVSFHPGDVMHRYCGNCHIFHEDQPPPNPPQSHMVTMKRRNFFLALVGAGTAGATAASMGAAVGCRQSNANDLTAVLSQVGCSQSPIKIMKARQVGLTAEVKSWNLYEVRTVIGAHVSEMAHWEKGPEMHVDREGVTATGDFLKGRSGARSTHFMSWAMLDALRSRFQS